MSQKRFDKNFKEQAARMVLEGGKTKSQVANEIGVHYTTVKDWVKEYEQNGKNAFPGSGRLIPEDDELRKLRILCLVEKAKE